MSTGVLMACGCQDRREALVAAAVAIAEGRGADARAELTRAMDSLAADARSLADHARAAADRVRAEAGARLAGRRR